MPRVITGLLSSQNKNAIDWGWGGYVAFGAQSFVVVAHPGRVEWIQTLDGHATHVTKVRWARENYPHEIRGFLTRKDSFTKTAARLRLASADSSGQIIIWDVLKGIQISSFNDQNKPVLEMFWLPWQDASNDLLLALHAHNTFVLWNADQATKIWRKSYSDNLITFCLDPFQFSNAAFLTQSGNLMLIDDFSFSKTPSGNGQQFKVSPSAGAAVSVDEVDKKASFSTVFIKRPLIKVLASVTPTGGRILETGDNSPSSISSNLSSTSPSGNASSSFDDNWAQLYYHPAVRNVLFLVYPREIVVLDSQTVQTITQIVFEKSASPLLTVIPCWLNDAIYFIQDNGTISFRIQKIKPSAQHSGHDSPEIDVFNPLDVIYELVCSSESLRVTKANRPFGVALCPVTQRRIVLLLSSGRLLTYELVNSTETSTLTVLSDMIKVDSKLRQEVISKLRFTNYGSLSSLSGGPAVVRACPTPSGPGKQSAAVGTNDGFIVLVDIQNGSIERELGVHSCPVKCLEWVGANHLVSSAYSQTLSTCAIVRNELLLTDVRTGLSKIIRPECDESPIELLRVSHFCSFLAVAFRDQPLEIWDLKAFRMLRRMAKTCPVIVDIAWSTKHNQSQTASMEKAEEGNNENDDKKSIEQSHTVYRENLVVLDDENHLYHVVVKGIHVRDGKEVNTQRAGGGTITAMAWKEEILVFGYADGRLSVWNLEAKQSKASLAQRGVVKRLQFSKQLTDLTFLVLHSDGVAIWNASKFVCLYQLNSFKDAPNRILDVDLAGEENVPLIITGDGCLHVYDSTLTRQSQCVEDNGSPTVFSSSSVSQSIIALTKVILLDTNVINCYNNLDFELVPSPESKFSTIVSVEDYFAAIQKMDLEEQEKAVLSRHLSALEENVLKDIGQLPAAPERVLAVCRLLGDEWDVNFWTLASGIIRGDSPGLIPTNFDLFWDNENFYKMQIRRCSIFDCKRCTTDQLHSHVENLILLGKFEAAAQVLLDTESGRPDYYADCLKACLLASTHTSPGCQSTMKLTATNLIADGKISEGVELLRIIDKTLDACRYLQSFSCWEKAAWLAKVALQEKEYKEILRRWVDALCGPQLSKKTFAVLLLLSLRQFDRLLELLMTMRQTCTAALFLDCISSNTSEQSTNIDKTLMENIYIEYARVLFRMGLKKVAFAYCEKAGDRGLDTAKELEILNTD